MNCWKVKGSGVQRRTNGSTAPGIQGRGTAKKWNYKNENAVTIWFFLLNAHSQLLCSSASFKRSTLSVRHPSRIPSLLDCYLTRHSVSLMFCSCELPCRNVECVLLRGVVGRESLETAFPHLIHVLLWNELYVILNGCFFRCVPTLFC